jgi:cbb3-type cytochrome oxidase subunit 3
MLKEYTHTMYYPHTYTHVYKKLCSLLFSPYIAIYFIFRRKKKKEIKQPNPTIMSLSPQHEQMSLGSPSQSPPMGGQYLPQFLQGDFHSSFNTSQVFNKHTLSLSLFNNIFFIKTLR